jgi:hypothetical protein
MGLVCTDAAAPLSCASAAACGDGEEGRDEHPGHDGSELSHDDSHGWAGMIRREEFYSPIAKDRARASMM